MTDPYFDEIQEELKKGAKKKEHPFRFFVLATMGVDTIARLRTVVLRKVTKKLQLTFYTDKRSKKIIHIKENNRVSLLFYHPEKLLQLRIEGLARVKSDAGTKKKYWDAIESGLKKDYTAKVAPGSVIEKPHSVEYLDHENHFCIVKIKPYRIEYLKLDRPEHTKVRFSKVGTSWKKEFLVP